MSINLYEEDIKLQINNVIVNILNNFISYEYYNDLYLSASIAKKIERNIIQNLYFDLLSFAKRDPASKGDPSIILHTYKSYEAVIYYRIANEILYSQELNEELKINFSRKISEYSKSRTGIEIHPGARIGEGFVIDHGNGTVIGETVEIGKNCYILQGVILGARGISSNPKGKRHPTMGDNVEIGAFSRVLGPITIGNNVMIAPFTIVLNDIPSNQKVVIKNQLQLMRNNPTNSSLHIYALVPEGESSFAIYGEGLVKAKIHVINENYKPLNGVKLNLQLKTDKLIKFKIENLYSLRKSCMNLQITNDEGESIYLINNELLNNLANSIQCEPYLIG